MMSIDIAITTDRTMMSNYWHREFLGFMPTAPPIVLPKRIWSWLSSPKIKIDEHGRPIEAPYGLRKIEAVLKENGFKAEIIDPDHLHIYAKRLKAIMIGHHDYFGFNPPSSGWWFLTGEEPYNRVSVLSFLARIKRLKRINPKIKLVVGGPSAWQWLYVPELLREYGIDTIIDGEGEKVVVSLAQKIIHDEELPRYIYVGIEDTPGINEIPTIKGASINGLVEIMRGCPRGCSFCSVTLRPMRHYPLEKIESELKINYKAGIENGVLHSDDVLLYGSRGLELNSKALLKLHLLAKKYYKTISWSHAALATIVLAQKKYRLLDSLIETILDSNQSFLGFQTGIETGSRRLAEKIMPGKTAPFPPSKWPEIVVEAFQIMHEHKMVPAATIILGLPGEREDDIYSTIELIEELKDYRSLIVPMFFVPLGKLGKEDWFRNINVNIAHAELLLVSSRHTIRWAKNILSSTYLEGPTKAPVRLALSYFIRRIERFLNQMTPEDVIYFIEKSKEKLAAKAEKEAKALGPIIDKKHRRAVARIK